LPAFKERQGTGASRSGAQDACGPSIGSGAAVAPFQHAEGEVSSPVNSRAMMVFMTSDLPPNACTNHDF
jgi:hypothetical protein